VPWLLNARDRVPGLAALSEGLAGFSARRSLPRWRRDWFRDEERKDVDGRDEPGHDEEWVVRRSRP